jgi:hypothetical protein
MSAILGILLAPAGLAGCLSRTMVITSTPPGATVYLNDLEVGRTPVEVEFEWYGVYDVRLRLEGCEPLVTSRQAHAPLHELPGIDFFTTLAPVRFRHRVHWHFDLTPALERSLDPADLEAALLQRARDARGQVDLPPSP